MDQRHSTSGRIFSEQTDRRLVLFVLGVALIGSIILYMVDAGSDYMPALILVEFVGILLVWLGQVRLAGFLAPLATLAVLTAFVIENFGIRDTAVLGFQVVIVAGSLMNGRRGVVLFGVTCLTIIAAMGYAELTGKIHWEGMAPNTLVDYLVVLIILIITMVIQWAVISRLIESSRMTSLELAERQRTESALRESEARYRSVVETFPDIIVLANLHQQVLFINDTFTQQTGYTLADLTRPINDYIHPEDVHIVRDAVIDLLKSDRACTDLLENRFIHKNGNILWYSGIISKVHYQGETCLQTITREVTAQKAIESALKENEERFRLISTLTSDYTFRTRAQTDGSLALDWVSGAFEAITGYSFEEYNATGGWFAHLHPEDVSKDLVALEAVRENRPIIHELRTIAKDKKLHWVRVYAHPVWNEQENRLAEIIGAVQDITARKEAEEKTLQATAELERRVLELSVLNEIAQAIAATRSEDEILETVVETLYHSLYPDLVLIALWDEQVGVLRTLPRATRGVPESVDQASIVVQPDEGVVGWVAANRQVYYVKDMHDPQYIPIVAGMHAELCVPILAGDRLVGVLDIESRRKNAFTPPDEHLLITVAGQLASALERLRAEQELRTLNLELERRVTERTALLEAANKELEAFSYSVSHDLRAPLRRINSFANILLEDFSLELTDDALNYVKKILGSSVKMSQLIDGLLTLSRLGRKELERQNVDLNQVVRVVIDTISAETKTPQEIEWTVSDLPQIYGDPVLVQQVFENLLGNAVKYTSKRAKALIEIGQQIQNGERIIFVRDNGAGFDMQYAGQLFGVFQRLHSDEEFEGTGIGLVTVRRIVERHGGRVWAEAVMDEGATFYIRWGRA